MVQSGSSRESLDSLRDASKRGANSEEAKLTEGTDDFEGREGHETHEGHDASGESERPSRTVLRSAGLEAQHRSREVDLSPMALDAVVEDLVGQLVTLRAGNEQLVSERDSLKRKVAALLRVRATNLKARTEAEKARDEALAARALSEVEQARLGDEHAEVRVLLVGLQYEHDALQGEHDSLQGEYKPLKNKHESLKSEHESLKREHQELTLSMTVFEHSRDAAMETSRIAQDECEALRGDLVALNTELEELRASREGVLSERDTLEANLVDTWTELESIRLERDELRAAVAAERARREKPAGEPTRSKASEPGLRPVARGAYSVREVAAEQITPASGTYTAPRVPGRTR